MHVFRKSSRVLRWWLALSLLLAPVCAALQGAALQTPPAQHMAVTGDAEHTHHNMMSAGDDGRQASLGSDCTQHDACAGQCCPGCMHCAGAVTLSVMPTVNQQPVLTPRESRLLSFSLVALRERPPRNLTV